MANKAEQFRFSDEELAELAVKAHRQGYKSFQSLREKAVLLEPHYTRFHEIEIDYRANLATLARAFISESIREGDPV